MIFAFAAARMVQVENFPELKAAMATAMGPAFLREKKAKRTVRFYVNLVPASWRVEANPFKLFHHRSARRQKWNFVNALTEPCWGAINILIASNFGAELPNDEAA